MSSFALKIYDIVGKHKVIALILFILITILLVLRILSLNLKEDITDFLPLDEKQKQSMAIFQDIAGSDNAIALIRMRDTSLNNADSIVRAVEVFAEEIRRRDTAGLIKELIDKVDAERITAVSDFVMENIPLLLTEEDYARFDTMLASPQYARKQIEAKREIMMLPMGGMLTESIARDPLNLFMPTLSLLSSSNPGIKFKMYDDCVFSPDMQRAVVRIVSNFGGSETGHNAMLAKMLGDAAEKTMERCKEVEINLSGGPVIAAENASQIKADSVLAVVVSILLISLLLYFTIRRARKILLIMFSVSWGWLFAVAGLSVIHPEVSIIVIGISSIIIGIAVNYPLHLIDHLTHTPDVRIALSEVVQPLVVGNITTVGAFLALVPLQSVALRDLGLFSSLLLIGTILFVIVFLPHLLRQEDTNGEGAKADFLEPLTHWRPEKNKAIVAGAIMLTAFLGYFSFDVEFDSNISHINYMTAGQREDMAYFETQMKGARKGERTMYFCAKGEDYNQAYSHLAESVGELEKIKEDGKITEIKSAVRFLPSEEEQERRIERWKYFVGKNRGVLVDSVKSLCPKYDFTQEFFAPYFSLLEKEQTAHPMEYFSVLSDELFRRNISKIAEGADTMTFAIAIASVPNEWAEDIVAPNGMFCFDTVSLNSAIASNLSSDFNYIGFICSGIVFFFLWFSFRSLRMAVISFVPMAISWVWILGIMGLCGIQFNIVNIILATFIFGQGDDYTIFMTEGAECEHKTGRSILPAYKHSILLSALIMFIGIGTLVLSKHPALFGLGEVTVIGMFSVVLMAYMVPPLLYKWSERLVNLSYFCKK